MKLSVIIPTLNESGLIQRTLQKVRATGANEVIVVDGGSQDLTREMARTLADKIIETPRGRALQLNEGAKAANGDVLLFLHADTDLPPDALAAIGEALTDPQVVGGRFNIQLDRVGWLFGSVAHLVNLRSRLTKIATGDQAIFVRREVFERIGGFPEIPIMEDVEFSRRIKQVGKIACLRNRVVTSARRWEQRGPLKTVFLMWGLRFLYFIGVSPDRLKRLYLDVR
ncbi:MAG: TIGR04283 family arsenosugar biosynthesis glycosyltransferase [Nitrospiria bacterium]